MWIPLLCKSGAIQHNKSYGRQAGKAGRLTDKMQVNFEFLKIWIFYVFNKVAALLNTFKLAFLAKSCFKVVVKSVKNPEAIVNPY